MISRRLVAMVIGAAAFRAKMLAEVYRMMASHKSHLWRVAGALLTITLISMASPAVRRSGLTGRALIEQPADRQGSQKQEQSKATEPWTASQTERPATLAKELSNSKGKKPLVVCVGFRDRYEKGHIPGAPFYGPASTEKGLEDLKKWAQDVPRTQPVVIYCGCCPMTQCPNVRPAFKTLQEMGFKDVKVLVIKKDFPTNWVALGYPVQRDK